MTYIQKILIGTVAILHIYFLILEMFLWTHPKGLKVFRMTLETAKTTASLAANQGLMVFLLLGSFGPWLIQTKISQFN